jgi:hypothetical protein
MLLPLLFNNHSLVSGLCDSNQADGVPTVLLFVDGKRVEEYNGVLTLDEMSNYCQQQESRFANVLQPGMSRAKKVSAGRRTSGGGSTPSSRQNSRKNSNYAATRNSDDEGYNGYLSEEESKKHGFTSRKNSQTPASVDAANVDSSPASPESASAYPSPAPASEDVAPAYSAPASVGSTRKKCRTKSSKRVSDTDQDTTISGDSTTVTESTKATTENRSTQVDDATTSSYGPSSAADIPSYPRSNINEEECEDVSRALDAPSLDVSTGPSYPASANAYPSVGDVSPLDETATPAKTTQRKKCSAKRKAYSEAPESATAQPEDNSPLGTDVENASNLPSSPGYAGNDLDQGSEASYGASKDSTMVKSTTSEESTQKTKEAITNQTGAYGASPESSTNQPEFPSNLNDSPVKSRTGVESIEESTGFGNVTPRVGTNQPESATNIPSFTEEECDEADQVMNNTQQLLDIVNEEECDETDNVFTSAPAANADIQLNEEECEDTENAFSAIPRSVNANLQVSEEEETSVVGNAYNGGVNAAVNEEECEDESLFGNQGTVQPFDNRPTAVRSNNAYGNGGDTFQPYGAPTGPKAALNNDAAEEECEETGAVSNAGQYPSSQGRVSPRNAYSRPESATNVPTYVSPSNASPYGQVPRNAYSPRNVYASPKGASNMPSYQAPRNAYASPRSAANNPSYGTQQQVSNSFGFGGNQNNNRALITRTQITQQEEDNEVDDMEQGYGTEQTVMDTVMFGNTGTPRQSKSQEQHAVRVTQQVGHEKVVPSDITSVSEEQRVILQRQQQIQTQRYGGDVENFDQYDQQRNFRVKMTQPGQLESQAYDSTAYLNSGNFNVNVNTRQVRNVQSEESLQAMQATSGQKRNLLQGYDDVIVGRDVNTSRGNGVLETHSNESRKAEKYERFSSPQVEHEKFSRESETKQQSTISTY